MIQRLFYTSLFSVACLNSAQAAELDVSGYVAGEVRAFSHGSQYAGQKNGSGLSVIAEPEVYVESDSGEDSFTFKPFVRFDPQDSDRSHVDVRELNWLHEDDSWELKVGLSKVFWGVAESNHLVDIINQTDEVESPDREDKLGQPMIQASLLKDWGTLRAFVLPYFRERTFVGSEGRLRGSIPVDASSAVYTNGLEERRVDTALRYEHTFGDWDIGLAHFNGLSREARLVLGVNPAGQTVLVPHYDVIDQTSLDLQLTTESTLYKLEALTRSGQDERFFAAVGGVEYTFYGIMDSDADLGFLGEYHRDDRGVNAPSTLFDDDFFTGVRLAMNDEPDTQFLGGVIVDRHTKNRFYSVEYSRRLPSNFKLEVEGRAFSGEGEPSSIALVNDDYIEMRLSYHF